jgi:hypothetical protein
MYIEEGNEFRLGLMYRVSAPIFSFSFAFTIQCQFAIYQFVARFEAYMCVLID